MGSKNSLPWKCWWNKSLLVSKRLFIEINRLGMFQTIFGAKFSDTKLVGGFNPSNWITSPKFGVKIKKYFKPPPRKPAPIALGEEKIPTRLVNPLNSLLNLCRLILAFLLRLVSVCPTHDLPTPTYADDWWWWKHTTVDGSEIRENNHLLDGAKTL